MIFISAVIILMKSGDTFHEWMSILIFFRYILLLSTIIPISLVVNCEFAKWFYCVKIDSDSEIPGTVSNNK